jgi:hypothetical protein
MALNAAVLKTAIKTDLVALFEVCNTGEGLSAQEYADRIAGIIASRVIEHFTVNGQVTTTVAGAATGAYPVPGTQYPVTGAGNGTIS